MKFERHKLYEHERQIKQIRIGGLIIALAISATMLYLASVMRALH